MSRFRFLKRRKFWIWFSAIVIFLPIILFAALIAIVYFNQDAIIQSQIEGFNKKFKGKIIVGDSHVEPFSNFPYISIKIDDVKVMETKEDGAYTILDVKDIYVGFDIWNIVRGNYDIESIVVEDGIFEIVTHKDGSLNIAKALEMEDDQPQEEDEDPFNIHLKKIKLRNIEMHKLDERTGLDVETTIHTADAGFKTHNNIIDIDLVSKFELNIIEHGDTTFIKHKHFDIQAGMVFNEKTGELNIAPSVIAMEHGEFSIEGSIDTENDMDVDIMLGGKKPSFDLFIAFAPEELIPVLERYQNAGKIYFNAQIKGKTANNQMPFIDAYFGASEAYWYNTVKQKRVDDFGFSGHFTNGKERTIESMEFSITDITAKPESGKFTGSIILKNFKEPEIDVDLSADFNLEFLAGFFNLSDLNNMSGRVLLNMKFHDIIDLENPEKAIEKLNEAYYTELTIQNLRLTSSSFHLPLNNLDMHLIMDGHEARLDKFNVKVGNTDISIKADVSDFPAILHHTNIPVTTHLEIASKKLDVKQLTGTNAAGDGGVDEIVENLSLKFTFKSTAKAFTESKYLPEGEFFLDDLYAKLKHYPHALHDFDADILIDSRDIKIVGFNGMVDDSDFHFDGLIHDYAFWMKPDLAGDCEIDFNLNSKLLRLEDIFSYGGENYVPADYRHEELSGLKIHGDAKMHFSETGLKSIDLDMDKFDGKMHIHPARFENFNGRVHYEDDHIVVEKFDGKIGRTKFHLDLNYYLGEDEAIRKRDNHIGLKANYIDFDELFAFNFDGPGAAPPPPPATSDADHEDVFNLYELPFTNMTIDLDIDHFIYHKIDLQNIHARLRTTKNHYIFFDALNLTAAGGSFDVKGYMNGSNPKAIYFSPKITVKNADLDRLMFKFDNFGQDEIVSSNLHGRLNASITGKIHMHADMVPILDDSEIHMDVMILNGRLDNYKPMLALSDYMGDKNLNSIKFDTLQNHFDLQKGVFNIPNMTIESTLGHFDISGKQNLMNDDMEYFIRIPWTLIRDVARAKLFGGKKTKDGETGDDEIIERDPKKNIRYLNLKIYGNIDSYKITLAKEKKEKKKSNGS